MISWHDAKNDDIVSECGEFVLIIKTPHAHFFIDFKDNIMSSNKTNFILVGALLVLSSAAFSSPSYNPDHLAQFNLTNQCYNCDLSGAYISGNHSSAQLASTNLTGSIGFGTFSFANFSGSNLSNANWSYANLSNAQMAYIPLINTDFSGADLSYANFEGSVTNNAVFDDANLYGANISQQQLDNSKSYCRATLPSGIIKHC